MEEAEVAADIINEDQGLQEALGIDDVDASWFQSQWVGSGTYATAFSIEWYGDDAVLKLTASVDECDIATFMVEEDGVLRGLAYVYFVASLKHDFVEEDLPIELRHPTCMIVTEMVDTVLIGWRQVALDACLSYLDRLNWEESNSQLWKRLTQNLTSEQRDIATLWLEDLRAGLSWIGEVAIPDTTPGNAGITFRGGREMAVWVDFGH